MSNPVIEFLQRLRRIDLVREGQKQTDGQLLERFVHSRDDAALEALVRRHAPMVWGVCRRSLFNHHDAEDAFQATFLVLVRKAGSLESRKSLAGWLYQVAHKTACKAKQMAVKRYQRERQVIDMQEPEMRSDGQECYPDLRPVLDEELSRLPEKYRMPIVLCDLQGKSRADVAGQLRLPEGTVGSRLARGRAMLAKRLARRGMKFSAITLAAVLPHQSASAAVPVPVLTSTIKGVILEATGQAAAGAVSAQAFVLTQEVLKGMALAKHKLAAVVLLLGALVPSGSLLAYHVFSQRHDRPESGNNLRLAQSPPEKVADNLPLIRHNAEVYDVALSSDGRVALSVGNDHTLRIWDSVTGELLRFYGGQTGDAPGVALSPDGRSAFCGNMNSVRCWEIATGNELDPLREKMGRVRNMAISQDGQKLLAGGTQAVVLWDLQTRQPSCTLKDFVFVHSAALSPDAKLILTGEEGSRTVLKPVMRLWDAETGKELGRFHGNTQRVNCVAFSPDSRLAVSGDFDKTVRVWDVASRQQLQEMRHPHSLEDVIFLPDGQRILSACNDGVVYLWDVKNGQEPLRRFKGHSAQVMAVKISRDGRYAISGSRDGTAHLWRLPEPEQP